MQDFVYPLIGIPLIFICTCLGALFVFFIRKKRDLTETSKSLHWLCRGLYDLCCRRGNDTGNDK